MTRRLNSDQLGKKGESRFPDLCTDAGLIANASTWDRKGWDFIVDWPLADQGPFDSRPTPFSCLAQLKTIWVGAKSVRLRLSSIEHLAKDLKPAFVYVLEVNDALELVGARLAHLDGELLAHVLKALRQATADGVAPNKLSIDLRLGRWFASLPPSGDALRTALEDAIGATMAAYATRKQAQLLQLGFEDGGTSMTTTFEVDEEDDVFEAFLGFRKLNVTAMTVMETRFGIELPLPQIPSLAGAEMEITPRPHDSCDIVIDDPEANRSFRFQGQMYGLPAPIIATGRLKLLIRNPLFDLIIDGKKNEEGKLDLGMSLRMGPERIKKAKARASEWRELYAFLAALATSTLRISIKGAKADQPFTGAITGEIDPKLARRWSEIARLAGVADAMLELAGWPATKLSIGTLGSAGDELDVLDRIKHEPSEVSPLRFATKLDANGKTPDTKPFEALYFGVVGLGAYLLVYAASLELTSEVDGDHVHWCGAGYQFRDVARVKSSKAAHDRFVADTRRRTGISSYFSRGISEDALGAARSDAA